jgi:photosystem II stability/assembly factor-like uncharacterized protein
MVYFSATFTIYLRILIAFLLPFSALAQPTWVGRFIGVNDYFIAAEYANNRFVAGSLGGVRMHSSDGIAWTKASEFTLRPINDVKYLNGRFVAVGDAQVFTSPDGETWTEQLQTIHSTPFTSVVFIQGQYVVVTRNGTILRSPDLIDWKYLLLQNRESVALNYLTHANGVYVAVGREGTVLTSTDALTWTKRVTGTTRQLLRVTFAHNLFIAVGEEGTLLTSPDGVNWTSRVSGTTQHLRRAVSYEGQFAVLGDRGCLLISPDGVTWTTRIANTPADKISTSRQVFDLVYHNGLFLAFGTDGTLFTTTLNDVPPVPVLPFPPVILTPENKLLTNTNRITASGRTPTGTTVKVYLDEVLVATSVSTSIGIWDCLLPVPVADGTHQIKATATNAEGLTSVFSLTHTFTVDTTPPATPLVLFPATGSTLDTPTPTFRGTTEPGSIIRVYVDGVAGMNTRADDSGVWSYTWLGDVALSNGNHRFGVTATDWIGNTSPLVYAGEFTVCVPIGFESQPADLEVCTGASARFAVKPTGTGYAYQWMIDQGNGFADLPESAVAIGTKTAALLIANASSTLNGSRFRCRVGTAGCSGAESQTARLSVRPGPTASAEVTAVSCFGTNTGKVRVQATGQQPVTYQLGERPFQDSPSFEGLVANTYALRVRDGSGCVVDLAARVNQPEPLTLQLRVRPVACEGPQSGRILAVAQGGTGAVQYQFNGRGFGTDSLLSGLGVGSVTVAVRDAAGCQAEAVASIQRADSLNVAFRITPPSTCSANDGTLTILAGGGVGFRQIRLDEGFFSANSVFEGLRTGTHVVTIRDSLGCTLQRPVSLSPPNPLQATMAVAKEVTCEGGSDGRATLAIAGGRQPYRVLWNTGETTPEAITLKPGTATAVVTDADGCTATVNGNLRALNPKPTAPTIALTPNGLFAEGPAGTLQWYAGEAPDGVLLSGMNATTLVPAQSGRFYVTVTAPTGCVSLPSEVFNYVLTALDTGTQPTNLVFPNPTVGRVFLRFSTHAQAGFAIEVFQTDGRLVRRWEEQSAALHFYEVDLSGLPRGVYLLCITEPNAKTTHRIVLR